ncbi:hypothetical protein J1N35_012400 [Gossypium stocksii]|uniref:SHSP domain-containing protein n=1 Tax=Gossypium stocksii TaxID=47602 RepID=A0A9D3W5D6_9ROSI|nr:hypothetical protein J1N35_012400 [Gossypium stocksii]
MSLIPSFFGNRRSNIFDPFAIDVWDPFKNLESLFRDNSALVNTCIDWKETTGAHVFKADLPGLEKEEIEDERVLQIGGERTWRRKRKTRCGIAWSGAVASSRGGSSCLRM